MPLAADLLPLLGRLAGTSSLPSSPRSRQTTLHTPADIRYPSFFAAFVSAIVTSSISVSSSASRHLQSSLLCCLPCAADKSDPIPDPYSPITLRQPNLVTFPSLHPLCRNRTTINAARIDKQAERDCSMTRQR